MAGARHKWPRPGRKQNPPPCLPHQHPVGKAPMPLRCIGAWISSSTIIPPPLKKKSDVATILRGWRCADDLLPGLSEKKGLHSMMECSTFRLRGAQPVKSHMPTPSHSLPRHVTSLSALPAPSSHMTLFLLSPIPSLLFLIMALRPLARHNPQPFVKDGGR